MIRGCLLILAVAPSALLADDLDTVQPLLAKYCQRCHGIEEQQAQVHLDRLARLAGFDRSTEQLWTSVHEVLIGGEMPPKGGAQPTAEERQCSRRKKSQAEPFEGRGVRSIGLGHATQANPPRCSVTPRLRGQGHD